jgi:hypothetical protein
MQPTKVKTSILTATGLITHTTTFRVEGKKLVANLADEETIEVLKQSGEWVVCRLSDAVRTWSQTSRTKHEALLLAAGIATQLAMCTD